MQSYLLDFKGGCEPKKPWKSIHKSRLKILYLKGHKGKFTHNCTECSLKFLTRNLLKTSKHLMEKFNRLNCTYCSDENSQVSDYANHLVSVHEMRIPDELQELKFHCRKCKLKFMSDNCFEYHLSRFHSPLTRKKTWTNTNSTTDSSRTMSTSKDEI